MSRLSRSRLSRSLLQGLGGVTPAATWASLGLMGINMPELNDYDKSQPFVDLVDTARGFRPYATPWTEDTQVALKANGQPAADFSVILLDNGVPNDVGNYLCGFSGTATPEVLIGCTIHDLQTSGGVTTFRVARAAFPGNGTDPRFGLMFSGVGANFGDTVPFYCLRVGVARGTGQIWGTAFEGSLSPTKLMRFMNWQEVNFGTTTETSWAGALAHNGKPWKRGAQLSTMTSLCNRRNGGGWFCLPVMANADYRTNFIAQLQAELNPGLKVLVEPANERWNSLFPANSLGYAETKTLVGARCSSEEIVSVNRVGSTVTAVLTSPHGKSAGQSIGIYGIDNITWGVYTLTSASGSTLVWTDPVSDSATGVIQAHDGSSIYLNPGHVLAAPGPGLPLGSIWEISFRLPVLKAREIKETIDATPGAAARMTPVVGLQLAGFVQLTPLLQWTKNTYGDCDWCTWSVAYYSTPADGTQGTLDTEQKVRDSLIAGRTAIQGYLLTTVNAAATYGITKLAIYEMGPHNDTKTEATQAAVAAVHMSDWMRLHAKDLYRDVRNLAPGTPTFWYHGGAGNTFGTTTNNTWYLGVDHISKFATFPKWQALNEIAAEEYAPVAIPGKTWGTVKFGDWVAHVSNRAQEAVSVEPGTFLPNGEISQVIQVDAAGNKTIALRACANDAGEAVTILVDGVVVANNVALPVQNQWAELPNVAWSGTVNLSKGRHKVTTRLVGTRANYIALQQYVFT